MHLPHPPPPILVDLCLIFFFEKVSCSSSARRQRQTRNKTKTTTATWPLIHLVSRLCCRFLFFVLGFYCMYVIRFLCILLVCRLFLLYSRLLCYLFRVFRKFSFGFDFLNMNRSFYELHTYIFRHLIWFFVDSISFCDNMSWYWIESDLGESALVIWSIPSFYFGKHP